MNADMCDVSYKPVCGFNGRTFSNICVAQEIWLTGVDCLGACPCHIGMLFIL